MTPPFNSDSRKKHVLYVLGVAFLVAAIIVFAFGYHNFDVRSVGLMACFGSMPLLRASKADDKVSSPLTASALPPPTRKMWLAGVILAIVLGIALYLLYLDALHGYREIWPVCGFAAAAIVCAAFWASLLAWFLK
jgi:uncharacterized membrane protein